MSRMFSGTSVKKLDLSKWEINSAIKNLKYESAATKDVFRGCNYLKYFKTPFGLTTKVEISEVFSVDVVKKGQRAYNYYNNNNSIIGRDAVLTYYDDNDEKYGPDTSFFFVNRSPSKGGCSFVRFDKNGGDSEAWVNDEIVEKGKPFSESKGVLPQEEPKKEGHQFAGWAYSPSDKAPTFNKDQKINGDMTLYAVYIKDQEYPLNESGKTCSGCNR